jgi:hypothetical protein
MIVNNYITTVNKDIYPCFFLSPFTNNELLKNNHLERSQIIYSYLSNRFNHMDYKLTISGRHSISLGLNELKPDPDSYVTIITTSQSGYVSKCVTDEISKLCKWNREISEETSVIFLIHEFGYPINNLQDYLKYNLPIIEDCAYLFHSNNKNNEIGNVGDYIIYSFPKFFPVQIGGILASNKSLPTVEMPGQVLSYIENTISHYLPDIDLIATQRLHNYKYYLDKLAGLPFIPRFNLEDGAIPGVFLFKINLETDLEAMKKYFTEMGVQCSVFYGENAFFLPIHQNINEEHIDFFITLLKNYLKI